MIFHYCKDGESVLSIAREHGISPVRLIEENALSDPDRLAVGQCLAIYRGARSYTVRGADTLDGIAARFSVQTRELIRFNPGIGERGLLYPGQILAIGRCEPSMGGLAVNGIVDASISHQKLKPYTSALTYLTILSQIGGLRSGSKAGKEKDLIDFAWQNGIVPLLFVTPSGDAAALSERLLARGYRGAYFDSKSDGWALAPYLSAMRSRGLTVCVPYAEGTEGATSDWLTVTCTDRTRSIARQMTEHAETVGATYQLMAELPCCGTEIDPSDGSRTASIPLSDCARLAWRRNVPIEELPCGKVGFTYHRTVHGRTVIRQAVFDDLRTIKNGLTAVGESGISAISIYPEYCPAGLPTLLHQCFDVIQHQDGRCAGRFAR